MTEISPITWHTFDALALDSAEMRVVLVPELGGKIVSIFDRTCQREWLVPSLRTPRRIVYGASFVEQDMSGWDEMFPTIVPCTVDGIAYPDHGEVWALPWRVEQAAGEVVLAVNGMAWPYSFSRSAALVSPRILELSYRLKNNAGTPFPCLWAAHPQFAATPATRIALPAGTEVINVIAYDPVWGSAGERHPWPKARGGDGAVWDLARVRPAENHTCRKFYLPPEQPVSEVALVDEGKGCLLRMSWSSAELPYLGLWVDEGMYHHLPVAAPEPSNGYYDGLDRAIHNGRVLLLAPGEEQRWKLLVQLAENKS